MRGQDESRRNKLGRDSVSLKRPRDHGMRAIGLKLAVVVLTGLVSPIPVSFAQEESSETTNPEPSPPPSPPRAESREVNEPDLADEPETVDPSRVPYDLEDEAGAAEVVEGLTEKVALREEDVRFFKDPNGGVHIAQVFADPIAYEAADGTVKLIETDMESTEGGYSNGANAFASHFPETLSSEDPIRVEFEEGELAFALQGVSPSKGHVAGESIVYEDVWPEVDLTYVNTVTGFAKFLKLESPDVPASFRYRIHASGVTLKDDPELGVTINADDRLVARLPDGYAQDSGRDEAGNPTSAVELEHALVDLGGGEYELVMTIPAPWFESPEREFPITVDPNLAFVEEMPPCPRSSTGDPDHCTYLPIPEKDSFVLSTAPNATHEGFSYLQVQNDSSANARAFVRFDTYSTARQLGNLVYQADFGIRAKFVSNSSAPVELKEVVDFPWYASSLTWNNQPPVSSTVWDSETGCGANQSGCSNPWYMFDAEGLMQDLFFDVNRAYHGFRLSTSSSPSNNRFEFNSKNSELTNRRPYLIMQVNKQPDAPQLLSPGDGANIETDTPPELRIGDVSDLNGDPIYVNYQVAEDPKFTNMVDESGWIEEQRSYTPTPDSDDDFKEGGTYYWRVLASDGFDTKIKPFSGSETVKHFVMKGKKRGTDPRWGMWDYELGNNMTVSVNQSNGNLVLEHPLDTLATPSREMEIKLSYNSQAAVGKTADAADEVKGPAKGWEISAGPGANPSQIPVRIDPLGGPSDPYAAAIVYDSGRRDTYAHIDGNLYKAIGPLAGTLHRLDSGKWSFTSYTGGQYTFTASGELQRARPSTSTATKLGFDYTLTTGDNPRVKDVTDATNPSRTVHFEWTGQRLSYVEAVGGRRWTFGYDTSDRLTSITDPEGATINFGYSSGRLDSITDGQAVADQQDSDPNTTGYDTEITYLVNNGRHLVDKVVLPGAARNTYDFDYSFFNDNGAFSKTTTLRDPRAIAASDPALFETKTEFNQAGLPIQLTQPPMRAGEPNPVTIQTWSGNGDLTCRREPLANARLPLPAGQCISEESTVYEYDNEAPYLLQKVTEPRAHSDARKLVTTYQYDQRSAGFEDLRADYWTNRDLAGLADGYELSAVSGWGIGGPAPISPRTDEFSARWTGQLKASHVGVDEDKSYSFRARLDHGYSDPASGEDGVRIIVGGELVINCWFESDPIADFDKGCADTGSTTTLSGTGPDEDDGWHDVIVEFTHNTGPAVLDLEWKKPGSTWSSIDANSTRPHLGILTATKVGTGADATKFSTTTYAYSDDDLRIRGLASAETLSGPAPMVDQTTSYTYDGHGRMVTETDATGKAIEHKFFTNGICERETIDRVGLVTERTCDETGDVEVETLRVRDGDTRTTTIHYTPLGRVDFLEHPDGGTTNYTYDLAGRSIEESVKVEERGETDLVRVTGYGYRPEGWLRREILPDPDGTGPAPPPERVFDYDGAGNVTHRTDARGQTWVQVFNGNNLTLSETEPGPESSTWSFRYDVGGNLTHEIDPKGVTIKRDYDLLNRKTSERTMSAPDNGSSLLPTTFEYDPRGNLLKETDPTGVYVSRTYDAADRVRTERRMAGPLEVPVQGDSTIEVEKTFSYDAKGDLFKASDFRGKETLYTYDDMGRLRTATLPHAPGSTSPMFEYERNKIGELETVRAPGNGATITFNYTYDAMGRKKTFVDGVGNSTAYRYNLAGDLDQVDDPRGLKLRYLYDGMGRRTERRAYDSADGILDDNELVSREAYSYDAESKMQWAASSRTPAVLDNPVWNLVEMDYNAPARLGQVSSCEITEAPSEDACSDEPELESSDYVYDKHRLASRADSAAHGSTGYRYDPYGRLAGVTDPFSGQETVLSYDDANRLRTRADPTGLTHSFTYDPESRWLQSERVVDGGDNDRLVAQFTSLYDADGNIERRTQFIEGGTDNGTWDYGYNDAGRLRAADMNADIDAKDVRTTYAYDGLGNRIVAEQATGQGPTEVITTSRTDFDTAARPLQTTRQVTNGGVVGPEVVTATYSHDAVGNLTATHGENGNWRYSYDAWSRQTEADFSPADIPGDDLSPVGISLTYDALDRTVTRRHETEVDLPEGGTGIAVDSTSYTWAGTTEDEMVAETTQHETPVGEIEALTTAFSWIQGTPLSLRRMVADTPTDQDPVRFFGLGPHGDVNYLTDGKSVTRGDTVARKTYGPWGELRDSLGEQTDFGYQGDLTDPETGLVDMGARNYDPALGRFQSIDPLQGDPQNPTTLNPYLYAMGDPLGNVDPDGKCPNPDACPAPPGSSDRVQRIWAGLRDPNEGRGDSWDSSGYNYSLRNGTAVILQDAQRKLAIQRALLYNAMLKLVRATTLHSDDVRRAFSRLYKSDSVIIECDVLCRFKLTGRWLNSRAWDLHGWGLGQASKLVGSKGYSCGERVRCYVEANWLDLVPWARGMTLGHTVFCEDECTPELVEHEKVHVRQFETEGITFPYRYGWQWANNGFTTGCSHPWEAPAYRKAGQGCP